MNNKVENNHGEELTVEARALLDKYGWFYHNVTIESPISNIHTHGLAENLNHMDIQLVLTIEEELVQMLFSSIVENIKGGYRYYEGPSNQVIEGLEVEFKKFKEDDREVLRLILPDGEGRFPSNENCEEPYSKQYIILE